MIKDVTLGQFFPGTSFLHKMDARVKIVMSFLIVLLLFIVENFLALALISVAVLAFVFVSKVSIVTVLKSVKPIIPLLIIMSIFNIFGSSGETLFEFGFLKITEIGIRTSILVFVRITTLIISTSLLTYTTSPNDLTHAIEKLFAPLKFIKVDVHTLAMIMTIALRFIPTLIEELDKIMNAQKARGANLDSGNFFERLGSLIPIFIPLFVSSIRRAYELAYAMECRCYGASAKRTRMKQMHIQKNDIISMVVFIVFSVFILLLNFYY